MSPAEKQLSPVVTQLLRDAVAAARAHDRAKAHALFRKATDLDTENESAWLWYANTADDPRDAVTGLHHALRLNPNNPAAAQALPVALVRAGATAARAGDRAGAAAYLAEATDLDPNNEAAWLWLAGVTDDTRRAATMLERVLRLNPDNAHARKGLDKLRADAAAAYRCPVCRHKPDTTRDTVSDVCGNCLAVVTLARPELFNAPPAGASKAQLEAAARRFKAELATEPTAEAAFGLVLALYNLGQREDGRRAALAALQARGLTAERRDEINAFLAALAAGTGRRTGVVPVGLQTRTPPPAKPIAAPAPTWVMVVDDSPTVRKVAALTLTGAGYRVAEAADADEAARLIREGGAPALFVLDVNMPGLDGFGLCKLLRAEAATARVPVIFLTGKTGLLNKLHGKWVGAADYLTKPFQPPALLAAVTALVPAPAAALR